MSLKGTSVQWNQSKQNQNREEKNAEVLVLSP
jgi:hypothetical protein